MSVTITLAGTDRTTWIDQGGLQVQQILGAQRDTATLIYKKFGSRSYTPAVLDTVLIQDGSTDVFGGRIAVIKETALTEAGGIVYELDCVDYGIDLDSILVAQQYTGQTVKQIIDDFVANFSTGFTDTNTVCDTVIDSISFNQMPMSQAIKKLADLVKFDWYVDADKDIHFFDNSTAMAPFNLTDTDGIHVAGTLETDLDGTQIANQVKVRGGTYLGATFSDTITVKGSVTKSWVLPYKFDVTSLAISINSSSKTVGVFGIDTFSTKDVLYRDSDQSIQVNSALSDGDTIAFSGTPLIPVLSMAGDVTSMATYGIREKLIVDSSITNLDLARVRAVAEVAAYKDPQTNGQFVTYTAGLRTGQTINLNSTIRSLNVDFIIKQVTFQMRTPTTFAYTVIMVSVKTFTLIELLQSMLLPADSPIDPNEVLETIRSYDESVASSDAYSHDKPTHPLEVLSVTKVSSGSTNANFTIDATGADTIVVAGQMNTTTIITFNGVSFTADKTVGSQVCIQHLTSPTSGSHTLNFSTSPSQVLQAYVYLLKGINTVSPVDGSGSGPSNSENQSITVTKSADTLGIGIMFALIAHSVPGGPFFTPVDGRDIEDFDEPGDGGTVSQLTALHRLFSRAGGATIATTFNTPITSGAASAMVLYKGFDPTT